MGQRGGNHNAKGREVGGKGTGIERFSYPLSPTPFLASLASFSSVWFGCKETRRIWTKFFYRQV